MDTDTLETVLTPFGVNNVVRFEQLSAGVENTNYHIASNAGDYVLRIYNEAHSIRGIRSLAQIQQELEFVLACKDVIPVAVPLANAQGDVVIERPGLGFCALFPYIEGTSPSAVSAEVAKEYASVLSRLYDISLDLKVPNKKLSHDIVSRARVISKNYVSGIAEIDDLIAKLANGIQASKTTIGALPKGMVHGDIKLANTLFNNGKLTALLDFDDCRYSYLLEDTVMAALHDLDRPSGNILRAGYLDELIGAIDNPRLQKDIHSALRPMIQARLLYDICKGARRDANALHDILSDPNVAEFL